MSIIKKYLISYWFRSFLSASISLFLLVGLSNIISELMRAVAPIQDILKNFLLEMPKWLNKILPVPCLMGGLFSLSKLQNRGELMAILSLGISRRQLITGLLTGPFVVAIFQFMLSGYIRPYSKSKRSAFLQGQEIHFRANKSVGVKTSSLTTGKIWYKGPDYFNAFSAYDKINHEFKEVNLMYFNPENNLLSKVIWAKSAKHIENNQWDFQDITEILHLEGKQFSQEKKSTTKRIQLNVGPNDFDKINSDVETLNFVDLKKYINKLTALGIDPNEYFVFYYQIISESLICIILAMLGCNAIYRPNRRNASFAKNTTFALFFTLFYWFVYSALLSLGTSGKLDPLIATSIPCMVGTIIICWQLFYHRELR